MLCELLASLAHHQSDRDHPSPRSTEYIRAPIQSVPDTDSSHNIIECRGVPHVPVSLCFRLLRCRFSNISTGATVAVCFRMATLSPATAVREVRGTRNSADDIMQSYAWTRLDHNVSRPLAGARCTAASNMLSEPRKIASLHIVSTQPCTGVFVQ